jgi:lipoprotein-anchoring transpeptidase ErfK/SrfK
VKRGRGQQQSHRETMAKTLLVVALAFAVLWQIAAQVASDPPEQGVDRDTARPAVTRTLVTTTDVNLRAGPGIAHSVLSVLPPGSEVEVIGAERDGFAPVKTGGQEAWISVDFIAPEASVLAGTVNGTEGIEPTAVPTQIPTQTPTPTDVPDAAVGHGGIAAASTGAHTFTATEPEPEAEMADIPAGERWVEVDRSTATVTLHEGNRTVAVFQAKIGKDPAADGYYSTALGTFHVFSMNQDLTETPFAPGVYLTEWVGFDPDRSNGFHSPVRDSNGTVVETGGTTTLGCVRLGEDEARQMFDFAFISMRVEIHD